MLSCVEIALDARHIEPLPLSLLSMGHILSPSTLPGARIFDLAVLPKDKDS